MRRLCANLAHAPFFSLHAMRFPSLFGSLRAVLVLQVALPLLLLLGLILAASMSTLGSFVEARMQRDLQLVARAIHLPVMQALARNNFAQLSDSLASVFVMTEVYGAYLFDADGDVLLSFGAASPTRRQAGQALKLSLEGEFAQYERIRGRSVYSFFLPLFDTVGQPSGLLQVTRLRSDFDRELTQLRWRVWVAFGIVALLILSALALAHQRAIGRPLDTLVRSIRRVATGERTHRAEVVGPHELRQLAYRLNDMLDAIELAETRASAQQQERARMVDKLRKSEALAALGQLSAGVAHELGAPLTVVDGRARRLLRTQRSPSEVAELTEIRDQVTRMTSIVEQLLSYGRSSQEDHRRLDVGALIERARGLLTDEGVKIVVRTGSPAAVWGDSLGLEQALVNLLRNAQQAASDGLVTVGWDVRDERRKVVIHVEDNGPGVPEAIRSQVFEPFFTTKLPGVGSGLGLAIVSRVMREHGGEVRLGSALSGGARFELWLRTNGETSDEA